MIQLLRAIFIVLVSALAGCDGIAGGGGSVHLPPEAIAYGEATPLQLELSVWGSGSGKVSRRYTNVQCYYRTENTSTFTTLQGQLTRELEDRIFVKFELPALSPSDGSWVEYYFDMSFDGHYNRRDVTRVPLR